MMPRRFRWAAVLLLTTALTSACALFARSKLTETMVGVRVENTLEPPTSVRIFVLDEGGTRRLLGPIESSGRQVFHFERPIGAAERFVAVTTSLTEIVSPPVPNTGGVLYHWDLAKNTIAPFDPEQRR